MIATLTPLLLAVFVAPGDGKLPAPAATVRVGETRMIAVRAVGIASLPPNITVTPLPNSPFEVIGTARTSISADRIFLRVRGVTPGKATLSIADTPTVVNVISGVGAPDAPQIYAPANGAVIWGKIAVGVEVADSNLLSTVELEVSGPSIKSAKTLTAASVSAQGWGPLRSATFDLDADAAASDVVTLTPIAVGQDGSRAAGLPTTLSVIRPTDAGLLTLEAETNYKVKRPARFADTRLSVGVDETCSNGGFLANYSSEPAMCAPVRVEKTGWYQVIGTFGGSSAAGTLPTVSLIIDGAEYGATNTRIIRESWHRVPLGVPVQLEAGARVLTPYFETDFYVERLADRNLKIDRLEVVRTADAIAPAEAASAMARGTMRGMMGGGMTATAPKPASGQMANSMANQMANQMAASPNASDSSDPWGQASLPLRVAFERPLHGQIVPGDLRISGRVWWQELETPGSPAPVASLIINGEEYARQWSAAPVFEPDSSAWKPGRNSVQLIATAPDGTTARTPLQSVEWFGPITPADGPHFLRYGVRDPAWASAAHSLLTAADNEEHSAFSFTSNAAADVKLPDDLSGRFQILISAQGTEYKGKPELASSLLRSDAVTPLHLTPIPHWWGEHEAGEVDLPSGPKTLRIAFVNDLYEEGAGDRNVTVQSISLRRVTKATDQTPPTVRILYPQPQQPGSDNLWAGRSADAIVIEAADDRVLVEAELIINGVQTGLSRWMPREPGRVVIPIMARRLEPGPHTIAVRVRDEAGNTTTSADRTFTRLADDAPPTPTRYERAIRLLNRFAFGPDEEQLAQLLSLGEDSWLRNHLTSRTTETGDLTALGRGLLFYRNQRSEFEVKGRALQQAIGTSNPVRMRFSLWAQNHFSTWINKTEGERKWSEHITFSQLGVAPFSELLFASATGPAMLRYLDQDASFAGAVNENYAREVMELHTLGVKGGYNQADVTALAHLLTGWTSAQIGDGRSGGELRLHSFRFDPALAQGDQTTILGVTFPKAERSQRYDRVRSVLELLAAHPSTATFVCSKLAAHYTQSPPDPKLVTHLAGVFESTGGDMREVLLALAAHPAFFAEMQPRLAHPLDYALRLVRTTNANNPWATLEFLQRSGAGLFDRATPDGYSQDDADYADSNSMVQRWAMAHQLRWPISNLPFPRLRWGNAAKDPAWAQNVIDSAAIRLTGLVLSEKSNQAVLTAAEATQGSANDRCRAIAELVAQMPECNLR